MTPIQLIARRLNLREKQVEQTIALLDEGATIPFISRYRKEATGGMDEVAVAAVAEQHRQLDELQHRKAFVIETIEAQGALTDELRKRIDESWDPTEVEDIYLPFKLKRRTRAQMAREKGLEPLAQRLLLRPQDDPELEAESFLNDEVDTPEAALQGARDIIAEQISEDEQSRQTLRHIYTREAVITSKAVKGKADTPEAAKYRDYFDWSEPLKRCTSHRLLAMRRGESEGVLRVTITPADDDRATEQVARRYVKPGTRAAEQIELARASKPSLRPRARSRPTKRPFAFSPPISSNCSSHRPSGSVASWASTPVSAQGAKWCVSMRRAPCSTMKPFIPTRRKTKPCAPNRLCAACSKTTPSRPWPSATAPRDAKPKNWCAPCTSRAWKSSS